ncbi:MAG: tol-pal system protein YbgF [Pseudomonadales bacterium]
MSTIRKTRQLLVLLAFLASTSSVLAQQVIESSSAPRGGSSSVTELFHKVQLLEQEVMSLRGQLEEQQHKLRRLSKQRLDDYVSLDKRISSFSGGGAAPAGAYAAGTGYSTPVASSPSQGSPAPAPTAASAPAGDPAMEQGAYQAAYELVKQQRFKEALPAFKDFILLYPSGQYAANAHYWLGELYLYEADLDNAVREFDIVVKKHPRNRKAPDALYKLGKAHHVRGDPQTARIMLNRVLSDYGSSGSNAVNLARDYLRNELGGG